MKRFPVDPRQIYSLRGAARCLGIDPKTLSAAVRRGDLPAYVLGKTKFSISGADLINFIEGSRVDGNPQ
ncbi:helix-turn-helix domain-containing protein [Luteococcus sp. Sow4_B9]|uniref:helix-turn-helix domain-containing protein n=1 Tax=Luteococcus sp. Sow4_B9 TaxID=3438792 RepID=UPI003F9A7432